MCSLAITQNKQTETTWLHPDPIHSIQKMNAKVLLAMSLDALREGEELHRRADHLQHKVAHGSSPKDFHAVKRAYNTAYEQFIRGLYMLNYCRVSALDRLALNANANAPAADEEAAEDAPVKLSSTSISEAVELQHFCSDKMTHYMDLCDAIRDKETNVLMSVEQAEGLVATGAVDKTGFRLDSDHPVFRRTTATPLKAAHPIRFETREIPPGSYYVVILNHDDFSVAAPVVTLEMILRQPDGAGLRLKKLVPGRCAWSRYFGVVNDGTSLQLQVVSDAWVRQSHVEVLICPLVESGTAIGSSPRLATEASSFSSRPPTKRGASASAAAAALPPLPPLPPLMNVGVVVGSVCPPPNHHPAGGAGAASLGRQQVPALLGETSPAAAAAPPPPFPEQFSDVLLGGVLPPTRPVEERLASLLAMIRPDANAASGPRQAWKYCMKEFGQPRGTPTPASAIAAWGPCGGQPVPPASAGLAAAILHLPGTTDVSETVDIGELGDIDLSELADE